MLAQRGDALGRVAFFPPDDFERGEREDALRGLLERAVEHRIHLVVHLLRRQHGRGDPEQRDAQPEPERDPPLQAARCGHATRPSR
ncbi:hypothetical protein D3C71_1773280 [compost metagenome]